MESLLDYTLDKTALTPEDTYVTVAFGGQTATVPITVSPYEKVTVSQLPQITDGTTLAVEG